jgi:hypothetical protein
MLQVWRICWNVIGTVLVSSGDDSCVRMWKGIIYQCFNQNNAHCCLKKKALLKR